LLRKRVSFERSQQTAKSTGSDIGPNVQPLCTHLIGLCCAALTTVAIQAFAQPGQRVGAIVAARVIPEYDDEYTLHFPSHVTLAGDTLFVADGGNARIVLFNARTLVPLAAFGRNGGGPGEFRRPAYVQVAPTTIAVGDAILSRISLFARDGRFTRTEALPDRRAADAFAVASDGVITGASSSPSHYLLRGGNGKAYSAFAPRAAPPFDPRSPGMHTSLVLAGPAGQIFVVDNDSGAVVTYSGTGRRIATHVFPPAFRAEILSTRTGFYTANPTTGRVFFGFPFAVSGNVLPTGQVFLFSRFTESVVGLIYDPVAGSFATIRGRPGLQTMDAARSAFFDGRLLYVAHDDGLRVYTVDRDTRER